MVLGVKLPFLLIIGCLISAFIMPVFARWKRELCAPLTILITGTAFAISLILAAGVTEGQHISYGVGGWDPPWGIEMAVEPLSSMMLVLISGMCFLIAVYSLRPLGKEIGEATRGWYYVEFLLCMTAMMGLSLSKDLFNMYVFIEIVGISACALVVSKGDRVATEATLKYLILATIGSGFILLGIGFIYMITGHLNVVFAGEVLAAVSADYPFLLWVTMSFFVVGFGVKAALFPLHLWLPDAHSSAPAPSSAILSGLVVKVYIITLFKLLFIVFGLEMFQETTNIRYLLMVMSSAAIIAGSVFAFVQIELKRRLAYSTVAQVGYIFLGIALGTVTGLLAAFLHIIVHAFMKTVLFLSAGAIYYQTGVKKVTSMAGMGYKMPVVMGSFLIASFSMIGIPFTGGFITKFNLGLGSLEAGYPVFILLIVVSGLLNAMYYFPILWQAYFMQEKGYRQGHGHGDDHGEEGAGEDGHGNGHGHGHDDHHSSPALQFDKVPLTMLAPIVLLASGIVYLGIFPGPIMDFINLIVEWYLQIQQ